MKCSSFFHSIFIFHPINSCVHQFFYFSKKSWSTAWYACTMMERAKSTVEQKIQSKSTLSCRNSSFSRRKSSFIVLKLIFSRRPKSWFCIRFDVHLTSARSSQLPTFLTNLNQVTICLSKQYFLLISTSTANYL